MFYSPKIPLQRIVVENSAEKGRAGPHSTLSTEPPITEIVTEGSQLINRATARIV